MASRRKYRKSWLRWHRQYERRAYREVQKIFHRFSNNIKWNSLTEFNYISEIQFAINNKSMVDAYRVIYKNIGLIHGKRVGKDINRGLKEFENSTFETQFVSNLALLFSDPRNGWVNRITSVNDTFAKQIIKLLSSRLKDGLTIDEAAREIKKIVNRPNFNRAYAMRIARTETTAAANFAASQAGDVSGYKMVKVWISAIDNKTREDHVFADGMTVPEGEPFSVGGESLMYPGDPSGSPANVINCRCGMSVIAERNPNGELIPKTS